MMTKKDYIRAAEIIRKTNAKGKARDTMIASFAVFFQGDNPRFDRDRFILACVKEK